MADFVTVNINVNGTVHKVKMEKGVTVSCVSAWNMFGVQDNKIIQNNNCIFSVNDTVKMSEDEFKMFKNIADNVKEDKGNEITLSSADIKKAQELFKQGNFTSDVSKGLTGKYGFEKECQKILTNGVSASASEKIDEYDPVRIATGEEAVDEERQYDYLSMAFKYDDEVADKLAEKYMKESVDGKVKVEQIGDGCGTQYSYTGKNGHTYTMWHDGYDGEGKLSGVDEKYTNEQGKTVEISRGADKSILRIGITYEENGKLVSEEHKADGSLSWKNVEYKNESGQKVTEHYDEHNVMTKKRYGEIEEEYEQGKIKKKYDSETGIKTYYENDKVVGSERRIGDTIYYCDKNNKIDKVYDVKNRTWYYISSWNNVERNEEAKKYYNEFKNMSEKDIADRIHSQVYGPSFNQKTADMLDGVPAEKLVGVLKEYNKITNIIGDTQDSLSTALSDEWRMPMEVGVKLMKRAFAAYMTQGNPYFSVDFAKICKSDDKNYVLSQLNYIEAKLAESDKYETTSDGKMELKDYWHRFKSAIIGN